MKLLLKFSLKFKQKINEGLEILWEKISETETYGSSGVGFH